MYNYKNVEVAKKARWRTKPAEGTEESRVKILTSHTNLVSNSALRASAMWVSTIESPSHQAHRREIRQAVCDPHISNATKPVTGVSNATKPVTGIANVAVLENERPQSALKVSNNCYLRLNP